MSLGTSLPEIAERFFSRARVAHPRLDEFNRLTFFWREFGLNAHDLEDMPMAWIEDMLDVGIGKGRAEERRLKDISEGRAPGTSSPPSRYRTQVERKQLL